MYAHFLYKLRGFNMLLTFFSIKKKYLRLKLLVFCKTQKEL